jgi:hypothetical protein
VCVSVLPATACVTNATLYFCACTALFTVYISMYTCLQFIYCCENDHGMVEKLGETLEGKATVITCMVDRICPGRDVEKDQIYVTTEPHLVSSCYYENIQTVSVLHCMICRCHRQCFAVHSGRRCVCAAVETVCNDCGIALNRLCEL